MALAKTIRPTLAAAVVRPRLFRQLDRARPRPVTWVWGPPGAGKTTLVASYLAARSVRSLWYQVDGGDADVATFFYYLSVAAPRRRRPLPILTPEYLQGLAIFVRRFFRDLYSRLKPPFALVFDNYQDAPANSLLHEVMREALAELPPMGRVIFISRSGPPPAFARFRSQRAIEILDWAQLRFTRRETSGLVRRLAPGRWPRETIRALYESADGWCAGLVLLLEQLRSDRQASPQRPGEPSGVLFDYFAVEIFKNADAETQEVLLQTAVLPRVTASVAERLPAGPTAGQILADLHEQNYFTTKQMNSEPTYEYHPLFREFLLSQALRSYPAAQRAEIRRAAARLVEAAGQIEAAAALRREAGDWEGLAGLVCRHAPTLLAQGRAPTVGGWLGTPPEASLEESPGLLYWRGIGRLGWRHTECHRGLGRAFTAFRRQRDGAGMFLAWSAVVQSHHFESQVAATDPWVALLEELMAEVPKFPSEAVEGRVAGAMLASLAFRQPHHPEGARWAERALELARRDPDRISFAGSAHYWFIYYWQLGDLQKASLVVDEMRGLMRARDVSPPVAVIAGITVALHEFVFALPSCRRTVSEMLELTQATGMLSLTTRYGLLSVGLQWALTHGDLETAGPWLQELVKARNSLGPGWAFFSYFFGAMEALIRGDVGRAASYLPEMLRLALLDGWLRDEVLARVLSVQILHQRGQEREARTHLERALEIARGIPSPYFEFMARLAEAQLCLDRGQEAEGLRALGAAMALGRKGGYVNSDVWQSAVMARLCARALEAGIEVDYVRALIEKRGLVPEEPPVEIEAWPWPVRIYTLGRFQVLRADQPLSVARKVQRNALATLKALIALGERGGREEPLCEALWPEAEGDAAHFALASALHRLRRLLGHPAAVVRKDDQVRLDARYCWVDAWAVERLLGRAEAAARRRPGAWDETIGATERAAQLYQGPFLGGEADSPGARPLADRLRRRLLRQVVQVGLRWEQTGEWQKAADCYETALRVDPCAEDASRHLMIACHRLGRPADVEAAYRRSREALAARLGVTPSPETQALLRSLHVG